MDDLAEMAAENSQLAKPPVYSGPPVGYWTLILDPDGHTLEFSHGQEIGLQVTRTSRAVGESTSLARSLHWLGVRTDKLDSMVDFLQNLLRLDLVEQNPDFAALRMPNGDTVELFGTGEADHSHFTTGPVPGFWVEDLSQTRMLLEAAGIEFLGPIEGDETYGWSHFRAPDGNVYELCGPGVARAG